MRTALEANVHVVPVSRPVTNNSLLAGGWSRVLEYFPEAWLRYFPLKMLHQHALDEGVHQNELHLTGIEQRLQEGPVPLPIESPAVHHQETAIVLIRFGDVAQIDVPTRPVGVVRRKTAPVSS